MSDYGQPEGPQPTNRPIPPHMQQHNVVGNSPLAPKPPKRHTLRTVLIVLAAVFGVMTAGIVSCVAIVGTAVDSATDSPTGVTSPVSEGESPYDPTTAPSSVPSSEPTATATEEPAQDTTTIGKTLTYESGLAVRVVSVKVFNPGSYASGVVVGQKAVKVTWTITNGTSANVDLTGAEARLTYGADGTQAESVYAEGVDGQYPFEGSVRPGQKKTATSAFSVPKAGLSKIVVEVEPEFNSQTAFFTGAAK